MGAPSPVPSLHARSSLGGRVCQGALRFPQQEEQGGAPPVAEAKRGNQPALGRQVGHQVSNLLVLLLSAYVAEEDNVYVRQCEVGYACVCAC